MKKFLFALLALCICPYLLVACDDKPGNPNIVTTDVNISVNEPVSELICHISVGNITVKTGETFELQASNVVENWLTVDNSDGILHITYEPPTPDDVRGVDTSTHNIVLTIPESLTLSAVELNSGTGTLTASNITATRFSLAGGSGRVALDKINAPDFTIEGGSGAIACTNITSLTTSSFSPSIGTISVSGEIEGNISIEGGTGTLTVNFAKPYADYSIKGEIAMSTVNVNGRKWNGNSNGAAPNKISIDGGMSTINLNFN